MKCFRCHSKDHLFAKCPYDVMMKMLSRRKERSKRRSKKIRKAQTRRRVMPMLQLEIVMTPQVMMRVPRRMGMLALPFKKRAPSSTLHHASWLRPLMYHLMMRMTMLVIVIVMMMNQLKIRRFLRKLSEYFLLRRWEILEKSRECFITEKHSPDAGLRGTRRCACASGVQAAWLS